MLGEARIDSSAATGWAPVGHAPNALQQRLRAHLPDQVRNHRSARYRGDSMAASLGRLSAADQERIRLLYAYAKRIHTSWLAMRSAPDWAVLRQQVTALLSPPLSDAARDLGRDTMAKAVPGADSLALGKALHDLRGGALTSLQLCAQMAAWETNPAHLQSAAYLARDQAKVMRNALPDLDPEVRRADEAEKPHDMQTVVDKWRCFRFEDIRQRPGTVDVACDYDGLLASCCLEASAVDRIVYNYVNNAIRFAAAPTIQLDIAGVDAHTVRWTVANPIAPDQADWLKAKTGGDLTHLFRGGLTRGGQGLGLSNCADFVAAAFGLPDIDSALDGRYLGAAVEDGWYIAWAHWPSLHLNG